MDEGWQIQFYDANGLRADSVEHNQFDTLQEVLEADDWDAIMVGSITTAYRYIKETVRRARLIHPDSLIVGGGGCFTSLPHEVMTWLPQVDLACIGEGFETIKEILRYAQDREWDSVKGIIWRDNRNQLHVNPLRPLISNLEKLPLPAYELLPMETYFKNSSILMSEEAMQSKRRIDLLFSFGCSLACKFCFHEGIAGDLKIVKISGKDDVAFDNAGVTRIHRWASPEHAVWMIKEANRRLQNVPPEGDIDFCAWLDENICTMHWASPNKDWVFRLRDAFIDEGFPEWIHHGGTSHASLVTKELLRTFKEMGFSYLDYGLEHASPLILKEIGKGATRETNGRAIKWTLDAGLRPIPNTIIGHPSESFETLYDLLDFWEQYNVVAFPFFATPYPGCFAPDTPIVLASGEILPIEKVTSTINVVNDDWQLEPQTVTKTMTFFDKAYKIESEGFSLVCTPEQIFYILGKDGIEEKAVEHLKTGDYVAQVEYLPDPLTSVLPEEKAQVIGYFVGDGCYYPHLKKKPRQKAPWIEYQIHFTDKDKRILQIYQDLVKAQYKVNPWIQKTTRQRLQCVSKELANDITTLGLNVRSTRRSIKAFFKAKNSEVARLLRGLFDAEGSVTNRIILSSSNLVLLNEVKWLLLRFGIESIISNPRIYGFSSKPKYRLMINRWLSIERFAKNIGFSSPRKLAKACLLAKPRIKLEYEQVPLPREFFTKYGLTLHYLVTKFGWNPIHGLPKSKVKDLAKSHPEMVELSSLLNANLKWRRIKKTFTESDFKEYYDFSVLPYERFLASVFPTHNCQWFYDYKEEILRQYNGNLEAFIEDLGDATKPTASIARNFTAIELLGIREAMVQGNRRLLKLYEREWMKRRESNGQNNVREPGL